MQRRFRRKDIPESTSHLRVNVVSSSRWLFLAENGIETHYLEIKSGLGQSARVDHGCRQRSLERESPLAEGTPEKLEDIRFFHVPTKPAQQLDCLEGAQEDPAGEQEDVSFLSGPNHYLFRKGGRVDVRALEPLFPVALIVDNPLLDVFPPQGGAAVDAEAIEAERVQFEPGRKTKTLQYFFFGLIRRTNQEEAVDGFYPAALRLTYRVLDLLRVCIFLRRLSTFWVPASTPKARKLQLALAMTGNWSVATESTRPSQPQLNSSLRSMMP